MATKQTVDAVVVGAGLSGLLAAHALRDAGLSVSVLEKGRGVGGRLATRRLGEGRADHGAQFFTVREPEFGHLVESWRRMGIVFVWSRGWSGASLDIANPDGYARYAVKHGFTTLPKQLSQTLDVHLATEVAAVRPGSPGWQIETDSGEIWLARGLVLTPPVPQTVALLDRGGVELLTADREALEEIIYAPCLCGLFLLSGPTILPEPGALQRPAHSISWLADNRRKGISPGVTTVTVHASPDASEARWEEEPGALLTWMEAELQPFLEPGTRVLESQLKRWRYALPTTVHPSRYLAARGLPPLLFAGDAFGGPRVEGAALSGMEAGAALVELL